MSVFRVLSFPHVLLRKKSTPIERFTPDLSEFAKSMAETMYAYEGIGLAAPQVGVLKRLIVVDIKSYLENPELKDWHGSIRVTLDGKEAPLAFPLTLVNPVIAKTEGEVEFPFDGCLSLPGVSRGGTKRARKIELKAQTVDQKQLMIECDGILSICLQHELDHLEGVLFIDRLEKHPDEKEVVADIQDAQEDPSTRKRFRKFKLQEAQKVKFAFV
jgi:peptide deformylase